MGLLGRKRDARFAPLTPVPEMSDLPKARLQATARYLGTVTDDGEKVIGQSLSVKSSSRLNLAPVGIDVVRIAGSFRIPAEALRGAASGERFGGRYVDSLLVVRWEHDGEQEWSTGFRMETDTSTKGGSAVPDVDQWVRTISKMARAAGGKQ
jgi:hypothetical protein